MSYMMMLMTRPVLIKLLSRDCVATEASLRLEFVRCQSAAGMLKSVRRKHTTPGVHNTD